MFGENNAIYVKKGVSPARFVVVGASKTGVPEPHSHPKFQSFISIHVQRHAAVCRRLSPANIRKHLQQVTLTYVIQTKKRS
jgi:hypothetical protein